MKFFIVVACALAAASAHVLVPSSVVSNSYSTYAAAPVVAHTYAAAPAYAGPQHLPVIGANGVPVDTPAVQEAKAAHFAKKAEAHARNGDYATPVVATNYALNSYSTYAAAPVVAHTYAAAPVVAAAAPVVAAAQPVYTGPQHLPVIGANGVPVDTPAVQNAKAAHFAQKAEAHARNGDYAVAAAPVVATTYSAAPVVAAAAPVVAAAQPVYTGPQHLPVIGANGVPVDTPAVQNAKAAHLAQKAEAHARNGDYAVAAAPVVASTYTAPVVAAAPQVVAQVAAPVVATNYAYSAPAVATSYSTSYTAPVVAAARYAAPVAVSHGHYTVPAVANSGYYAAPAVATTYAHSAPVVSSYAAYNAWD